MNRRLTFVIASIALVSFALTFILGTAALMLENVRLLAAAVLALASVELIAATIGYPDAFAAHHDHAEPADAEPAECMVAGCARPGTHEDAAGPKLVRLCCEHAGCAHGESDE